MTQRLTYLRESLNDLDAILISQPENRRYLSGFTGSACFLLISKDHALLATDFRYYTQVKQEARDFDLAEVGYEFTKHLPDLLAQMGARRVGFEAHHLTFTELEAWKQAAPNVEWIPTTNRVEDLRTVKSVSEIETLKHAVHITDKAFAQATDGLRPGTTEKDLVWALKTALHKIDGRVPAFDIIVAAGLAGAKPHAKPSDTPIPKGVPIVIDMGALIDGYHADMTRTLVLGQPDDKFRELYQLVLYANQAALNGIRPGMTDVEADALSRSVIEEAGYGDFFGHGLGHGVGLAIHEAPRLATISPGTPLKAGMAITIEPGIYLPDWGGIRIEDLIIVREAGVEVLTQTPKDLEAQIIPV
jgi:Xaa-Pro aminopeptidase